MKAHQRMLPDREDIFLDGIPSGNDEFYMGEDVHKSHDKGAHLFRSGT